MEESDSPMPIFKAGTLAQSPKAGQKKRMWKSLKQILATEKSLPWGENDVTCKF